MANMDILGLHSLGLLTVLVVSVLVVASFVISASAGLGGSLLMVPTLALVFGPKEGIALAALLLGANNLLKVLAYRRTVPWRKTALVVAALSAGSAFGASLLVRASETLVGIAVIVAFSGTFISERMGWQTGQRVAGPLLAFGSGAASGFSGTSGPLKGVAIRNLSLDRLHFVGAASLASLVGDVTKASIFTGASIIGISAYLVALGAFPLMVAGTWIGRTLNRRAGERRFAMLFWSVMAGYTFRVVTAIT